MKSSTKETVMTTEIKTIECVLPESTLPYFINGDETGYEDDELEMLKQYVEDMVDTHGSFCAMTDGEEGEGFMAHHDLHSYGWGSCDCTTITFSVDRA